MSYVAEYSEMLYVISYYLIFISFDEISNIDDDNIAANSFDMIGLVESVL